MSKDNLGSVVRALVNVPSELLGMVKDFVHKITGKDRELWIAQGKLFLQGQPCWTKTVEAAKSVLRLVSAGQTIVIAATSGKKTIAQAGDIFQTIDPDFENWDLDVPGEAEPATPVNVYELVGDGDFRTIFYGSLGRNLNDFRFTQEQIIVFVHDHKKWLCTNGSATFFLFKVAGQFFVARVCLGIDGKPCADVSRFSYDLVWGGSSHRRVVAPQQTMNFRPVG